MDLSGRILFLTRNNRKYSVNAATWMDKAKLKKVDNTDEMKKKVESQK